MDLSHMLCASFNHDGSYLACGFENGFSIFQCSPFHRLFSRKFLSGGIGIIELLDNSNLVAIVGGGTKPFYSPNSLLLWDDKLARFVSEININQKILAVRLYNTSIIIVSISGVYVYDLHTLKKVQEYSTYENTYGLVSVNDKVFIIPGREKGSLRIISHTAGVLHLDAHDNSLHSIALSARGNILATVSEKGTLIRLYNTDTGNRIQVLRRGIEKASVPHLIISRDEQYVACISENQTLHLFSVTENVNATSLTTIFTNENKSISRMSLTSEIITMYMIDRSSIYLVSSDGEFYWFSLDDDLQIRLQSVSKLNVYDCLMKTNKQILFILSNTLLYTTIIFSSILCIQSSSFIISRR